MTDVIIYSVLSLAALYCIYRADPEHLNDKYTSIWSFYRSVFSAKNEGSVRCDLKDASNV